MSSAAEAEICGTYKAMQNALPISVTLEELGYPQPKHLFNWTTPWLQDSQTHK
jgi:hypothetical protein